ncbi:MAG: alpha/beta hydrolase-fold protein [Azospirillaceae bacterium]
MRPDPTLPRGSVERITVDCRGLRDNLLGDPAAREIGIYRPHDHDGSGLPLLISLAGFTGSGLGQIGWKNFGENAPQRLDRLIATGAMPPVVVAFPDCFTRLGGNQFVNSPVMGPWDDVLVGEMLPAIEAAVGCGGPGRRGLFGKSSGGYGAIVHGLLHGGDVWHAVACHSGDMGFDLLFGTDFPIALRKIEKHGSVSAFIASFEADQNPSGSDIHAMMVLAMCATYDPAPAEPFGIRLPVTADTCERIEERWARFMEWDPLTLLARHAENLRALKALFIDCGRQDEYNLLYGARQMTRDLTARGIDHRYEEFEGTHRAIDHRQDESLPFLAKALSA